MNKRWQHNGGYVLPAVMVVVVLLGILTLTCYETAVRNLQAQIASEERMKNLYEAEGRIEKYRAKMLEEGLCSDSSGDGVTAVKDENKAKVSVTAVSGNVSVRTTIAYSLDEGKITKAYYSEDFSITTVSGGD